MKLLEQIDRLMLIVKLIKQRRTGTCEQLAKRVNLSRRRLYEILEELKSRGAPIEYSKQLQTYYYSIPYEISISYHFGEMPGLKELTNDELGTIKGGNFFSTIFQSAFFPHTTNLDL